AICAAIAKIPARRKIFIGGYRLKTNMKCSKAEEFLVEYLYEELSPSRTVQLEMHLKQCDGCKIVYESWKSIHQIYRDSTEKPELPIFLKQKILRSAREELIKPPSAGQRLATYFRPIALAASALAVLALTIFVIRTP